MSASELSCLYLVSLILFFPGHFLTLLCVTPYLSYSSTLLRNPDDLRECAMALAAHILRPAKRFPAIRLPSEISGKGGVWTRKRGERGRVKWTGQRQRDNRVKEDDGVWTNTVNGASWCLWIWASFAETGICRRMQATAGICWRHRSRPIELSRAPGLLLTGKFHG